MFIWDVYCFLYEHNFSILNLFFYLLFPIENNRTDTAETQQQDAAISKLIKDIDTYKELLKSTEARLSKRIKELSNEVKSLVNIYECFKG